jgi:hypothetical protein
MVAHRQGSQHQGRMTGKILHNDRAAPTPTFATGMEEVASIADAGGHGTLRPHRISPLTDYLDGRAIEPTWRIYLPSISQKPLA